MNTQKFLKHIKFFESLNHIVLRRSLKDQTLLPEKKGPLLHGTAFFFFKFRDLRRFAASINGQ